VVLNREGAAGTVGFSNLAAAAPDGHTLAFGPTTPIANAPYLVWVQSVNATRLVVYRRVFQSPRSCVGVD